MKFKEMGRCGKTTKQLYLSLSLSISLSLSLSLQSAVVIFVSYRTKPAALHIACISARVRLSRERAEGAAAAVGSTCHPSNLLLQRLLLLLVLLVLLLLWAPRAPMGSEAPQKHIRLVYVGLGLRR
jgi:hypothetical protein